MDTTTLNSFVNKCIGNFDTITDERKQKLSVLSDYIQTNIGKESLSLIFICTHNSRRSFFTQVWAQVAAYHFDMPHINVYSGGTSETAIFTETIAALQNCGLETTQLSQEENPVYSVRFHPQTHPVIGFSKVFDHNFNPKSDFAAVMTCGDADANCPFIPSANARISLTYIDPKQYDNTPEQESGYFNKSVEIATEMLFVFSQIKK